MHNLLDTIYKLSPLTTFLSVYIAARALKSSGKTFDLVSTPIMMPDIIKNNENQYVIIMEHKMNSAGIAQNLYFVLKNGQLKTPLVICSDEFFSPGMRSVPLLTSESIIGASFEITYKNLGNKRVKISGRVNIASNNVIDYQEVKYRIK